MEKQYPGPFCKQINLSSEQLHSIDTLEPLKQDCVKNGVVFEIQKICKNSTEVVTILKRIQPALFESANIAALKSKLNRLTDIRKKFVAKKKVKGYNSFSDFLDQSFDPPVSKLVLAPHQTSEDKNENALTLLLESMSEECLADNSQDCEKNLYNDKLESTCETRSVECQTDGSVSTNEDRKNHNLYLHEHNKENKSLTRLQNEIQKCKEELRSLQSKVGHYSVRNVNKRDETARQNRKCLREVQHLLSKQKQVMLSNTDTINRLQQQIEEMSCQNKKLKDTQNSAKEEEKKKILAQKTASYYKMSANKLRQKFRKVEPDSSDQIKQQKNIIKQKDMIIKELETNIDLLKEQISQVFDTKESDGSFTDSVRLCVIELSGLEVAVEKVPSVIQSVSKHLFGREFEKHEIPSSTTVQTIVDEGHFLAKAYISKQLSETENWGLNRDGTTRRKQKIVDTSITLATGEILSLGFNRVAHETAETINNVTKKHVQELADLNSTVNQGKESELQTDQDIFLKRSLEKLAFTMSDRASNEKKADKLLDEWRDSVLGQYDENEHSKVLHFHCMAHVLLGFHRYICKDIVELEKDLVKEKGPLGRDSLPCFKYWSKKNTAVERTLRTVSEVFGPAGDHHGVRDLWEAHCAVSGKKSVIGNYRDNRFNALFQTAAEVFHHKNDFVAVLECVTNPNLKLKSVLADLKSDSIMSLVQCLGVVYLKITGPYWNLVTSVEVPYLELYKEIAALNEFLLTCEKNPSRMLETEYYWKDDSSNSLAVVNEKLLSDVFKVENTTESRGLLLKTLKLVCHAMNATIQKQLNDFLRDGNFGKQPSREDLKRTQFAHLTNLGCEHHFGDLDSSQRRRPSATMHHHSSVQLLKRNRTNMMDWLVDMPGDMRTELLKSARKGGKELRKKHRADEHSVLEVINAEMMMKKATSKRRKTVNDRSQHPTTGNNEHDDSESDTFSDHEEEAALLEQLPTNETIKDHDYVAVAYQDAWYPGIVIKSKDENNFIVKFMAPARRTGCFSWPSRDDIQSCDRRFILCKGFIPECLNSGRLWEIKETSNIEKTFKNIKKFISS